MPTKVRELPSNIAHLQKYVPPPKDRVRHDEVWGRLVDGWKPGERRTAEFTKGV